MNYALSHQLRAIPMKRSPHNQYTRTIANVVLLIFLMIVIFLVMLFPLTIQRFLYQIFLSGILIAALFCINSKFQVYMRWLVASSITLLWVYFLTGNDLINGLAKALNICLFLIIAVILVRQAAFSKSVTRLVILESVNGYLMIAMFYSIIIALVVLVAPGAYRFSTPLKFDDKLITNFSEYLYYGFNAFTTVTYGDVLPISPIAKSISMSMGFIGQMYIAIVIAMLVGKFSNDAIGKQ